MTVVTTDRLVIRAWTDAPADLDRFYDIYSRDEVMRWLGGGAGRLTDPAQAAPRLAAWSARFDRYAGRYGLWAVQVRATGVVAGTVLVKPLPGCDGETPTGDIEVGWHLHPDAQGHGYATEAARAMLDREFALGGRRVYAVVAPGNERSTAVCRRLGMTPVGRRTNWYGGVEVETFVVDAP
ncbi:Protein N-acetyltransferase, RimJ/RimL family [Micromonospora nigra]|uniref:Protein N-acetyltransferase, RimJ/RimL family n=1 Tax=Micromonospora nigra TaxID=145857 RepID=A0A1C6SLC1_9ACTN|nr:GNAT family N-acetyltransferase [Micromonospora nigra]SCL30346.1 Protein N-acetyltransferase, RimJ/RimL family [Micromonospora nigra]